jgi:4-amino-4-deoxy-L-arabinose transferase-like glycosyltransferase
VSQADETKMAFRYRLRDARGDLLPRFLNRRAYWTIGLIIFCLCVLFFHLGTAVLFEPDEGRNAEIAREILLLKDWVTPHYDFIPRLDKPISYFWLVALSFRLFGLSEWSARLPSALAALACLSVTYALARAMFGRWAGLWSVLVLLTSIEFFAFSRIVILDMVLTFLFSLALCSFFLGQREVVAEKRRLYFSILYVALGAASLVKGPIGLLLPAAVIFFYRFFTKRWALLRRLNLPLGLALFMLTAVPGSVTTESRNPRYPRHFFSEVLTQRWALLRKLNFPFGLALFVLTAVPWYLIAESRNPGFLRHFFWEENLARFATMRFNGSQPWYFFLLILPVGFFPWTALLPGALVDFWKRQFDDRRLFLLLWAGLPLIFFSLSLSKLHHYILPIYPPLAIIVGASVAGIWEDSTPTSRWLPPMFPAFVFFLLSFVVTMVALRSDFLPIGFQAYVHAAFPEPPVSLLTGLVILSILILLSARWGYLRQQVCLYPVTALSFALFVLASAPITAAVATNRSSEQLALKAAHLVGAEDQLVLYDGYFSSLPFYLDVQRPIRVVWSGNKSTVLGSDYVALKRPEPAPGYGNVLYSYEEFAEQWQGSKHSFVVFVNSRNLPQLEKLLAAPAESLLQVGDTAVVKFN